MTENPNPTAEKIDAANAVIREKVRELNQIIPNLNGYLITQSRTRELLDGYRLITEQLMTFSIEYSGMSPDALLQTLLVMKNRLIALHILAKEITDPDANEN